MRSAIAGAGLVRCCSAPAVDPGYIFAEFGYVLMFVAGVISVPVLVQPCSRLRDIGRRLRAEGPDL